MTARRPISRRSANNGAPAPTTQPVAETPSRSVALLSGPPGVLRITVGATSELYLLSVDDEAYVLQRLVLPYRVTQRGCTCPGFQHTGHCKHWDAILALQKSGKP
jgi:hypothetical protein